MAKDAKQNIQRPRNEFSSWDSELKRLIAKITRTRGKGLGAEGLGAQDLLNSRRDLLSRNLVRFNDTGAEGGPWHGCMEA